MIDDTIFAVSSGQPPAGIAVIRISGRHAFAAAAALGARPTRMRTAELRAVRDPVGDLLDRALVLGFEGPHSATGEDVVELHCHGGRAVVAAVMATLATLPGCRIAAPGEFTRRALEHGRIDLSEAEGLADLLEAETEQQRVVALRSAEGAISRAVGAWMADVAALSARIEVLLDYADEDDASDGDLVAIRDAMIALGRDIADVASAPPIERIRDGIRVVLAGPPNAGKSTLLNLMAQRDAAIVTPIAGTTRDVVEVPIVRNGRAYLLLDTAGLTDSDDVVEAIGVGRAQVAIREADLVIWMGDDAPTRTDAIVLHARADRADRSVVPAGRLSVSRDDRASVELVWAAIEARMEALLPRADALPLRQRHRDLCVIAATELEVEVDDPLLLAEHLRRARLALAAITGADATELMLDQLFGRFCLGK